MIYEFNKWLFSRPEIYTPYNDYYGLSSGNTGYWDSWASSPVFPWGEQPEADDFYIVYQTREEGHDYHFWETKVYVDYFLYANNIKLIDDTFKAMIKKAGHNEYSVIEFDKWQLANNESIDGYTVQDMYFDMATDTRPQEQENGVFGKAMRFCIKLHDC